MQIIYDSKPPSTTTGPREEGQGIQHISCLKQYKIILSANDVLMFVTHPDNCIKSLLEFVDKVASISSCNPDWTKPGLLPTNGLCSLLVVNCLILRVLHPQGIHSVQLLNLKVRIARIIREVSAD